MLDCAALARHYGFPASPPGASLKLQGERIVEALLFGDACRIGSTPPSSVITDGTPLGPPSVARIITTSPFCNSARVAAGMRLMACWKSPLPPAPLPGPAGPFAPAPPACAGRDPVGAAAFPAP